MVSNEPIDVEAGKKKFPEVRSQIEPVALRWSGLSFDVKEGGKTKRILEEVSGELLPGEVTAIMGPSGAGKSTLLNVLAGRAPYGEASGSVELNGEAVDPVSYRKKIAYVMQEDALYATQTPRELLRFTAALKLAHLSAEGQEAVVEDVLHALELKECADTLVGSVRDPGLSGGQRKRTAVAVELLSSPSVIFLDEPTSGLDAHSAFKLVKLLRELAQRGCTIVCTIHQPSSEVFEMFDKVMLLRKGRMVYSGAVERMTDHFADHGYRCKANYNPADFVMFQLKELTDEEVAPLIASVTPRRVGSDVSSIVRDGGGWLVEGRASFPLQLWHLSKREAVQLVRDVPTLVARFVVSALLGLLIGLSFKGAGDDWGGASEEEQSTALFNHYGAMSFFTINQMFQTAQPLLLAFPLERPVYLREYASGTYSTTAYLLAKTLMEIPASFVQVLMTNLVVYWLVGFQGNFILIVLVLTLQGVVAASTALVIGAAFKDVATAVNLTPVVYVPQILFSGAFISLDAMPVFLRWAQYLCSLKYAINLFSLVEFHDGVVPDDREALVHKMFDRNDIDMDDLWIYLVVMFGIFVVLRFLAAFFLSWRARNYS